MKTGWFKYFGDGLEVEEPKGLSRLIQVWDTAFKEAQRDDRSACITLAETRNPTRYFVLDLFVQRLEFPRLIKAAQVNFDKWKPDRVLIEDKASGISLIQQLRRDTKVPIRAVKAVDDKVTRAHTVTGTLEAGQVFLPARASWLAEFLKEVGDFPTGAHDDIPDVLVHGLRYFKPRLVGGRPRLEGERKASRWRE